MTRSKRLEQLEERVRYLEENCMKIVELTRPETEVIAFRGTAIANGPTKKLIYNKDKECFEVL